MSDFKDWEIEDDPPNRETVLYHFGKHHPTCLEKYTYRPCYLSKDNKWKCVGCNKEAPEEIQILATLCKCEKFEGEEDGGRFWSFCDEWES